MADKLDRAKDKQGYYNGGETDKVKDYCVVSKKVKKNNITPDNIGSIILSQIPGVSSVTALVIIEHFGSLYKLFESLIEDESCLRELTYTTKDGKTRHLSSTAIKNVRKYLLYIRV